MSNQTLTTKHVWDVASVKAGAAEIDRDYARIIEAEKRLERYRKINGRGSGKGGHGGFSNFTMGLKDLASGRTIWGVQRLYSTVKNIGLAAQSGALAFYAMYRGLKYLNSEMRATQASGEKLQATFDVNARTGAFQTGATSYESQSTQRSKLQQQLRQARDQQNALSTSQINMGLVPGTGGVIGDDSLYSKFRRSDFMTGLFGERKTEAQKQREATSITRGTESQLRVNTRNRTGRMVRDKSIVGALDPSRGEASEFNAKMQMLRVEEAIAEERLKEQEATKEDLKISRETFSIRRAILHNERGLAQARNDVSLSTIRMKGGGGSAFSKQLGAASMQYNLSDQLLKRGGLTEEEKREEEVNKAQAKKAMRSSLMDRYLDPTTGRRRRAGVIQREFRNERNATRRRNAFLTKVDAGQYNMETGRKASIGGRSGLMSKGFDGWAIGGANKGAMSATASTSDKLLAELIAIIDKRLPKD